MSSDRVHELLRKQKEQEQKMRSAASDASSENSSAGVESKQPDASGSEPSPQDPSEDNGAMQEKTLAPGPALYATDGFSTSYDHQVRMFNAGEIIGGDVAFQEYLVKSGCPVKPYTSGQFCKGCDCGKVHLFKE